MKQKRRHVIHKLLTEGNEIYAIVLYACVYLVKYGKYTVRVDVQKVPW